MAETMVTLTLQTTIEHDIDDDDDWIEDYNAKLDALMVRLSEHGTVDVMSEELL